MRIVLVAFVSLILAYEPARANEFSLEFEWGDLKLCTSGNPNRVTNPTFTLTNVPEGTVELRFRMTDKDVPQYNHGGGKIAYNGETVIEPGQFKYKSPCPPNGPHTYEWRALAKNADGDTIGKAYAKRKYPE